MTFPGEKVTIRNGSGTIYQKSENALAPDRIAALLGLDPEGKKFEPGTPYVDGNWLSLDFQPEKHGNYWIGLASHPRKIPARSSAGGQEQTNRSGRSQARDWLPSCVLAVPDSVEINRKGLR